MDTQFGTSQQTGMVSQILQFCRKLRSVRLVALAGIVQACGAFPPPGTQQASALPASFTEMTSTNASSACLEPTSLPSVEDYNGPLAKAVGVFAAPLERKSVHPPRYMQGVSLCTLDVHDKFLLFVHDTLDPITFLSAAFDGAVDHASNRDPQFGQGFAGYGKRALAEYGDRMSSSFLKSFAFPVLFSEDPRYYRLGQGPVKKRVLHAAEHLFVAHHADGTRMFNYSQWLGTTSSAVLHNTYHPGNETGFGPMSERIGFDFASSIGFDILREFWPDVSHKFKLPFAK